MISHKANMSWLMPSLADYLRLLADSSLNKKGKNYRNTELIYLWSSFLPFNPSNPLKYNEVS